MVAPLIIAAGVAGGAQLLSTIAQLYQSEKARKAGEARLREIEALFNAIKPPEYDVSVIDPPELITQSIPEPAFDMSNIDPEMYSVAAKYVPEVATYIAERNPQVVELSAAGQYGRDAQIQALNDIRMRTGELSDAEAQSASAKAMRDAQIAAQSRSQTVLQDANRRGQLGSGAMLAAQLQGGSDAMERAAGISNQAYLEALRNKLGAITTSGEMGRQLAGDEFDRAAVNADIINRYNQRAAAGMNQYGQYAADVMNRGQLFNVENAQDIANRNVTTGNQFNVINRERQDKLLADTWNRQFADRAAINQAMNQGFTNQLNSQAAANAIKGQGFQDQMSIAAAKSGLGFNAIDRRAQYTRDQNQAIQGLGKGIGDTAMTAGYLSSMYPDQPQTAAQPSGGYTGKTGAQSYYTPNQSPLNPTSEDDFDAWYKKKNPQY